MSKLRVYQRAWRIILFSFLFSLIFILPIENVAQSSAAYEGIDIIFAVDVSGSMYQSVSNHDDALRIDRGLALYTNTYEEFVPATDPSNERFQAVEFAINWLAQYSADTAPSYGAVNAAVHVVSFDNERPQEVLPWRELNNASAADLSLNIPQQNAVGKTSDFIELYDYLGEQLAQRNNAQRRRQVVVIITDSLPCEIPQESVGRTNGRFEREGDSDPIRGDLCDEVLAMNNHLDLAFASFPRNIYQYFYHLTPKQDYWNLTGRYGESLFDTLRTWQQRVEDNGIWRMTSYEEETVSAPPNLNLASLPYLLFGDIAQELSNTMQGGLDSNPIGIGLIGGAGPRFVVPPYQEYIDIVVFGDNAATATYQANGQAVTPDDTLVSLGTNSRMLRFNQPVAGQWQASLADAIVWTSYQAAEASVNIFQAAETQYSTARIEYNLGQVDENYLPVFDLTVFPPQGDSFNLTMSPSGSLFLSETFYLLEAGDYRFDFDVRLGDKWNDLLGFEISQADASTALSSDLESLLLRNTLNPRVNLPDLAVEAMRFVPTLGTEEQQAELERNNGVLRILRSETVPFSLSAMIGENSVPIPPDVTIVLSFSGSACEGRDALEVAVINGVATVPNGLRFETGNCEIDLDVSLAGSLKPFGSGLSEISLFASRLARVEADDTIRLDMYLLDNNKNPIPTLSAAASDVTHYEMLDLQSFPSIDTEKFSVNWDSGLLTIELIFVDEANERTDPIFASNTLGIPSSNPDLTDEQALSYPVPFTLSIVREGETANLAESLGIALVKSTNVGTYLADLHDIPAGHYVIQVELLRDDPAYRLISSYEYANRLTEDRLRNPLFTANLLVSENIYVRLQWGTAAVLALLLTLYLLYRFVRGVYMTRGKLMGEVLIYQWVDGEDEARWHWVMPVRNNTNRIVFEQQQLLDPNLLVIPIRRLELRTKGDGKFAGIGGAYFSMDMDDRSIRDKRLNPEEPYCFSQDYYILKAKGKAALPQKPDNWTSYTDIGTEG